MGKLLRWLLIIGMVLQSTSLPAHAWWKAKVAINEKNAAEYIEKLKSGADPNSVVRPTMRFIKKIQAKNEQKRFFKAMDEAEALARAGKHEEIKELELKYQDLKSQDREDDGY